MEDRQKEVEKQGHFDVKEGECQWKVPGQGTREGYTKHDSSSTSSFFSGSNFTMSCSGADEQEDHEPSTSGCSSFLAHSQRHSKKEKKKARVQEYLKELKALVKPSRSGSSWKMGTLSTLEHVLSSMKKIKEAKAKHQDRKIGPAGKEETPYTDVTGDMMHSVYESDSHESLACASLKSSDELRVILSGNHSVEAVSGNLQYVVGYPKDCWLGRSLLEYIHKKDIITFRGVCKPARESETSDSTEEKLDSKVFYIRLRKFKSLGMSGFSLRKQDQYIAFQCSASMKRMTTKELELSKQRVMPTWYEDVSISANSGSPQTTGFGSGSSDNQIEPSLPHKAVESIEGESNRKDPRKLYTILYCVPLTTPYSESGELPEVKTFETRHTLFCSYCHVQPDTIPLLGYLPQEMIGVSIFDFYHNDDLNTIYKVYQKVIALRGVPFKSGPIRILAKNGSYVTCSVEWSSYVNPWSNRLEFIVSKHTVVKGPENTDVFSENYQLPSIEDVPDSVVQTRQKIKDLLMQPVQTEYTCTSPEVQKKHKRKTVAIIDKKDEEIFSDREPISQESDQSQVFCAEQQHGKGLYLKEASISRTYEQLNYTNCIKKFLLGQPRTFSSDSDVKKSSSEDGFDCEDVKETVPADAEFDFDINVPKPPSFGSSTKVLVSEQEHRDVENVLEPICLREQLAALPAASLSQQDLLSMPFSPPPPLATTITTTTSTPTATTQAMPPATQQTATAATASTTDSAPVMNLTRDLLQRHTVLQEQLYVATASPDRNIIIVNEGRDGDSSEVKTKRQSLKRIHSPDRMSLERCKSGRHAKNVPGQFTSILNPSFPLIDMEKEGDHCDMDPSLSPTSSCGQGAMHMYTMRPSPSPSPLSREDASLAASSSLQQWPFYHLPGVSVAQQVRLGYHNQWSGPGVQTSMAGVGFPVPVYQLNSLAGLQQASGMVMSKNTRMPRKKTERGKSKAQIQQSSSETSSTEDTSSSLYLLESSVKNMKMAYNKLVLQSQQRGGAGRGRHGLKPAPWLEGGTLNEAMGLRYQVPRVKPGRQLKKDREVLAALVQPDLVMQQLEQHMEDLNSDPTLLYFDEDQDVILQREARDAAPECSCVRNSCCRNGTYNDHGILEAIRAWRKAEKKEKRGRKTTSSLCQKSLPECAPVCVEEEDDMEVDNDSAGGGSGNGPDGGEKTKTESCSSKSGDSMEGENFIRCDMSSDSINSLNTSDVTPSDQRSTNENGSSMKESDGDAMSKKSDSSSSDKQQTSESESDSKVSHPDWKKIESLFGSLLICFPHMHKENAPWLVDVDFTEDVQLKYTTERKDSDLVLQLDRERLQAFEDQGTVTEQFATLIEDISTEKGIIVSRATVEQVGGKSSGDQVVTATSAANEAGMADILDDETFNSLYMSF